MSRSARGRHGPTHSPLSAGDIHGALDRLDPDVPAFEAALGEAFDHVLHVGEIPESHPDLHE